MCIRDRGDVETYTWRKEGLGFICLLQISAIDTDYVFDAIKLRPFLSDHLADIFADKTTVKLFHAGDYDLKWLKVDFGFDIDNLFDTERAFRELHPEKVDGISLRWLVELYFGVRIDKRYQISDWRIRPLPPPMLDYCRKDSALLLLLFKRMNEELNKLTVEGENHLVRLAIKCNERSYQKVGTIKTRRLDVRLTSNQ
eukprot:TRINITY_DN12088_c0_g1_i1.p1 TRINITY_DN12088_c0_g1~~TRINITY_DN12088_c0_g1_i1.p1  ORF type:complete len:214 (-),score=29.39 TRINITY_DN12088_c0_g1_i1:23-616(-)